MENTDFLSIFDRMIDSCESEEYFNEELAIEIMNLMVLVDSEKAVQYISKYVTNFVYEDKYHFIGDANENFRLEATKLLGKIGSSEVIPALGLALDDVSLEVIIAAVKSLGNINDKNRGIVC